MNALVHKYFISFIIIIFFSLAFLVRAHINNTIIPERERQIKLELKEEFNQVKLSFQKNKFNDAKNSANYLLESYLDYLSTEQFEKLKLIVADSILEQALKEEVKEGLYGFQEIYKELELSENPRIKIDALMGQARGVLLLDNDFLQNINVSIPLLEKAIKIGQQENLEHSKLVYLLANLNIDRYKINRKHTQKMEAINLLKSNIENISIQDDYVIKANSIIELALLFTRISSIEQVRYNLQQASEVMEQALINIPKEKDPVLNAKIYRIIGDIYYLNSKVPRRQNEAGPRYVQSMVSFQAKAKSAYRKAEQMGIFNDIVPGVKVLKNKDAETRKKLQRNTVSDTQEPNEK